MNFAHHRFTPVRGAVINDTGDQIARALAKFAKSPQQLENEKRLFRFRAKRDLKAFIHNIRDERDMLNQLQMIALEYLVEPPATIDEAISRLERHMRVEKSFTGTVHAVGNHYMAVKQRLFLARYFRRFGSKIWESV